MNLNVHLKQGNDERSEQVEFNRAENYVIIRTPGDQHTTGSTVMHDFERVSKV